MCIVKFIQEMTIKIIPKITFPATYIHVVTPRTPRTFASCNYALTLRPSNIMGNAFILLNKSNASHSIDVCFRCTLLGTSLTFD